jgi:hypothetical protein
MNQDMSSTTATLAENAYNFASVPAFTLALRYYLHRVLVCGLLQSLCALPLVDLPYDLAEIEREDLIAAQSITRCADFGLYSPMSSPLVALKLIIPLQLGFGGWHRLEKRQISPDTADYYFAVQMKSWHIDVCHEVDHMWYNIPNNYQRLELICEMFAGGPLFTWMHAVR